MFNRRQDSNLQQQVSVIEDGCLQGLDFVGTAHSANFVSNKLGLQLSVIAALKTADYRELQFLEKCGFDRKEIRKLETGQFISNSDVIG